MEKLRPNVNTNEGFKVSDPIPSAGIQTPCGHSSLPLVSFVIAARNEKCRIANTLTSLRNFASHNKLSSEIIVVDDGSRDETSAEAQHLCDKLIKYQINMGTSYAFRKGAGVASGSYVVLLPADVYDLEIIKRFVQSLREGADIVQASKRHRQSKIVGYTKVRWVVSNIYNFFIRKLFGVSFTDTDYAHAYRSENLRGVLPHCRINRAMGEAELNIRLYKKGAKYREVPCNVIHKGKGTVSLRTIFRATLDMFLLKVLLALGDE